VNIEEKVLNTIFKSVDELNEEGDLEDKLEKSLDTILLGTGSTLDSLGIVNFIVLVEQNIDDAFGLNITLADERALSQKNSPFSSIKSLSSYIELLVKESLDE